MLSCVPFSFGQLTKFSKTMKGGVVRGTCWHPLIHPWSWISRVEKNICFWMTRAPPKQLHSPLNIHQSIQTLATDHQKSTKRTYRTQYKYTYRYIHIYIYTHIHTSKLLKNRQELSNIIKNHAKTQHQIGKSIYSFLPPKPFHLHLWPPPVASGPHPRGPWWCRSDRWPVLIQKKRPNQANALFSVFFGVSYFWCA